MLSEQRHLASWDAVLPNQVPLERSLVRGFSEQEEDCNLHGI